MFRIKSYLQITVTKRVDVFFIAKNARESYILFAIRRSFFFSFYFILRNPIRSGRNLRRGWTSAFNYNRADRGVFLQKRIYIRARIRTFASARINKLQRASVMRPAFSTRSPGLIPNNVPQTARHAIENKTPSTPRRHTFFPTHTHRPDIFMGCMAGFMARAS